jgi:hypothetical protein
MDGFLKKLSKQSPYIFIVLFIAILFVRVLAFFINLFNWWLNGFWRLKQEKVYF